MTDFKDMMAKKVQAAARGYIARKTGMGKKKRPTNHAGGKQKPGAKKKKKDDNVEAMVIQAAFRKYQQYQKTH